MSLARAVTGDETPVLWVTEYPDDERCGSDPVYTEHVVLRKRIPSERTGRPAPVPERPRPVSPGVPEPPAPREARGQLPVLGLSESIGRLAGRVRRTKPSYADCWLVGSPESLESPHSYETPCGTVVVGRAGDGETEYNLTPKEYAYGDSLNSVVGDTIGRVRAAYRKSGGRMDRHSVSSLAKGILMDSAGTLDAVLGGDVPAVDRMISEIAAAVCRYTVGLGIFEVLMADPDVEDIYIDAPCDRNRIHITMGGAGGANTHARCRTNLMVDRREVQNLISVLKRDSGLPFCESNPILETDIRGHDARATVVGYPMSPNGDAVAIRKHSVRPWTLSRLIGNGTLDPGTAGLLSFLVDNRCTFLICGARGAGKSSLLSALMFEFPTSQRILTIEDTMELPGERMRRLGYRVQSMLIDDRRNGDSLKRADEALRVSLRMGESAIILGEVRGEEARTLYQSMRTGRAGSSIMGTIHGDSARSVFDRVVHDMQIAPEAFMATDVLVTVGTVRDRRAGGQARKVTEIAATSDRAGEFSDMRDRDAMFSSPVMRRVLAASGMGRSDIMAEVSARGDMRAFLADMAARHGDEFFGPEWIISANDHLAAELSAGASSPASAVESFRRKFRRMNGLEG